MTFLRKPEGRARKPRTDHPKIQLLLQSPWNPAAYAGPAQRSMSPQRSARPRKPIGAPLCPHATDRTGRLGRGLALRNVARPRDALSARSAGVRFGNSLQAFIIIPALKPPPARRFSLRGPSRTRAPRPRPRS